MTKTISKFRPVLQNLTKNPGAEMLRYGWQKDDVISLGQGEGCDPTPPFIYEAAYKAMAEGKTHYGPVLGQPLLREEISTYYKNLMNIHVPSNRIFITGSGTTAMHLALTSILDKGDEVVGLTPIWKNLLGAVEVAEAHTHKVSLDYDEETGWSFDIEKLFAAVTDKTKAILIVSPSNPTGWVMSLDEMGQILEFARERGIWIVSDEVYNRSYYGHEYAPSFLEIANDDDLVMTVNSFSKNWAMTGWRLGWLVGPSSSEGIIRDLALYDNMGPPTFTQFSGIEALKKGEGFIKEQVDLWQSNLDYLYERLSKNPKVSLEKPKSTFYAFFRVKGEEDCLDFAKRLIDEGGVSLAPGCAFGQDSKGWIRLCFAVSRPKLEKALDRIEEVIG
ncbi:MAG: pyridoxal phosphate-dependent aminotransferase [Pseudomonadota bacterium]